MKSHQSIGFFNTKGIEHLMSVLHCNVPFPFRNVVVLQKLGYHEPIAGTHLYLEKKHQDVNKEIFSRQ